MPECTIAAEPFIYQNGQKIETEKDLETFDKCNLCVVEIQGKEGLFRSCETVVSPGMTVATETPAVKKARKERLTAILTHHPNICLTCDRDPRCPPFGVCSRSANVPDRCVACPGYATCELIRIADHIGMIGVTIPREPVAFSAVSDNPFFEFAPELCVGCTRCIRFCKEVRGIGALGYVSKGNRVIVGTKAETFLASGCHFCFGCIEVCPTGALVDKKTKWKEEKPPAEKQRDIVPCMAACPLHLDIPNYIFHISQGRYDKALAVIEEKLPFAALCGTVCTHPCEAACRRTEWDQPVAIKDLKRFVAEQTNTSEPATLAAASGKQVAVVGSGPAGLAAAYVLRKHGGHAVTIFEAMGKPGGMPLAGIPPFRLPKAVLTAEIKKVTDLGVTLMTQTRVESAETLFALGFDAVLMCIGAHEELTMGVAGETQVPVTKAVEFLRQVNFEDPVTIGDTVAVIGGGNVALDAARTAKRLGATAVTIVYRRSRDEMPAYPEEIEQADAEGIEFMFLAAPVGFEMAGEKIRVTCVKNKLKRADASGRRRPKPIKGSEFSFEVDTVMTAIGQTPQIPNKLAIDTDPHGRLKVSENQWMTSRRGVFAAGDAVSGPKTVTEAIAMGIRAANAIHEYLGGGPLLDLDRFDPAPLPPALDPGEAFLAQRVPMPLLPAQERARHFDQVELGFTEEMALKEARRCLRCSLRLAVEKT